ncbi:hypothetical protein [Candidatus Rhabdochlamydia porcellionis]|jgi:hypothetical protein|uniref:Uncharacterized protein n=1 Tax=Candidatus Rhabdochlamydia porcellionis TaxID=225148 RepID=A0ABX8Z148_9BACT|nr:hypothetical protein [Candidatus Rhabdochlamydia porcellionis]QZA59406.1 hypothetical protein RHAB15C_0001293 [Candidatus Rhabdochlamydia porcellionis]
MAINIIKSLELAWQNDSFYMQTISKNATNIFKSGVAGCLAGRITRTISPKDGAIFLIANRISDTFIEFIESSFVKNPFMSNTDDEKSIRFLTKFILSKILTDKMIFLVNGKPLPSRLFSVIKFLSIVTVIDVVFDRIALYFPLCLKPRFS